MLKVLGSSMIPILKNGDFISYKPISSSNASLKKGLIVIAKDPLMEGRLIIKRILEINGNSVFLISENKKDTESYDSYNFGYLHLSKIIGIAEKVFSLNSIKSI